jgi:hypothetical protein
VSRGGESRLSPPDQDLIPPHQVVRSSTAAPRAPHSAALEAFKIPRVRAVVRESMIMGVLNSGMSLLGLGTQVQSFIKGIVLLLGGGF